MNYFINAKFNIFCSLATLLLMAGCGGQDRVIVTTGTQVGLEATPGDATTQAPSVSFGYKRVELALVPVHPQSKEKNSSDSSAKAGGEGGGNESSEVDKAGGEGGGNDSSEVGKAGGEPGDADSNKLADANNDAYSVLTTFNLALNWFGPAKIEQFIATGHAARKIQAPDSQFFPALVGNSYGGDEYAAKFNRLYQASLVPPPLTGTDPHANKKACWNTIHEWKEQELPGESDYAFANYAKYKVQRGKSATAISAESPNLCAGEL